MDPYKKKRINVEVNLASQTHQVPQVGLPHTEPLIKAKKVKLKPTGAAALKNIPAIFALQTIQIKPNKDRNTKPDWPIIAEGT